MALPYCIKSSYTVVAVQLDCLETRSSLCAGCAGFDPAPPDPLASGVSGTHFLCSLVAIIETVSRRRRLIEMLFTD